MPDATEIEFAPDSGELARLREHTRAVLDRWGHGTLAPVASLLVTELATNAIVHTRRPARLRLVLDDRLRIEVTDTHSTPPTVRRPSPGDVAGGRGLAVVSESAEDWGYTRDADGGKTVWCELLPPWVG